MQSPARHQFWGLEMDDRLRAMVAQGLSFSQIGEKLGRTRCSCIGRAHRLGISNVATKPVQAPKAVAKPKTARKPVERLFDPPATTLQDNRPEPLYEQPEASVTAFGKPRTLMKLKPHHCRFPFGERDGQHLFCGADRDGLKPYCPDHADLCLRPTPRQLTTKAYR